MRLTRLGHSRGNHLKMKGRVSLFLVAEGVGGNGHFLIMCGIVILSCQALNERNWVDERVILNYKSPHKYMKLFTLIEVSGAAGENRTLDLSLTKGVLYL